MVRLYFTAIGFGQNYLDEIKCDLQRGLRSMIQVYDVQECDVIVASCTIVSRVGTDVEAALREIPAFKPVILLVLHHTFDKDYVVPDTQQYMGQRGQTVDLLFHEDQGLLFCQTNAKAKDTALESISRYESGHDYTNTKFFSIHAMQFHQNPLVIALLVLFFIVVMYTLISSWSE